MIMNPLCLTLIESGRETVRKFEAHPVASQLMHGTLSRALYCRYLSQVVHQVRGSAPMLQAAARRLSTRPQLQRLSEQKSEEEAGHDRWAMNDLQALGVCPEVVEQAGPSFAAVNAYVAWTRYVVELSPVAVFGVAWTLEWLGFALAGRAAAGLLQRSRIPGIASAVTFLRGHGDADQQHIAVLQAALGAIDDRDECEAVELSARVTAALYLSFFDGVDDVSTAA